jgi:DHA3 family macrolide efflux protein-like MFS transporter
MENYWKKNAALFLCGQGLSLFGSMLVQYAIMWYITLRTQSGSMMTVFIIAGILPNFFISPFGGVWADRFNKKYLINAADASIALATLVVAFFFIAGIENIGLLLFCAVIRALGQGIQTPAVNSFIPLIVPEQHLTRINGINGSLQSFIFLTAPLLSGALLTFASMHMIFFIDVITAVIGICVVFFFVKIPAKESSQTQQVAPEFSCAKIDYFSDMKEGLKYIRRTGYILHLIIISTVFYIVVSPTAFLTPLQVTRNFGAEVWRLTAIEIAFSSGMMLGGILISVWGGFKNRVYSMALSCVMFGAEAIALGLISSFIAYLVVMALMGMTMPLYNTPSMTLLQSKVESAYLGRVFGVFGMVSSLMMPAGMLIFGPLGDIIAIEILLVSTGIVLILLGIPFVCSRTMRHAGKISA